MAEHPATVTYSIAAPFPQALKSLRSAFDAQGLQVSKEVNIAGRIRDNLMIGTQPCVVLLVSPRTVTGESLGGNAEITPMHVVVSTRGSQSEVHILRILRADAAASGQTAMAGLNRLQIGIFQAVESIGMRVLLTDWSEV